MTPVGDCSLYGTSYNPSINQEYHLRLDSLYFGWSSFVPPIETGIWFNIYDWSSKIDYQPLAIPTLSAIMQDQQQYYGSLSSISDVEHQKSKSKPRCWEHGCEGREFSSQSNLKRHRREKSGSAPKLACHKCAASFSRASARNIHVGRKKCTKRNKQSLPDPVAHPVGTIDQPEERVDSPKGSIRALEHHLDQLKHATLPLDQTTAHLEDRYDTVASQAR